MLGLMKLMKEIYKLLIGMNLDKKKIINEKIFIYIIVPFTIIMIAMLLMLMKNNIIKII